MTLDIDYMKNVSHQCDFLVRLEFEIKLEPLLLYSPPPPAAAAIATPPLF